jgi:hypothetical protein
MFVAVVAVASVVPVSLLVSMARRVARRTVDCCLEHARQTSNLPWPPRVERVDRFDNDGRNSIMEIIHSRCAGMDDTWARPTGSWACIHVTTSRGL